MNIVVWILVSVGGYSTNNVTYSPPFADLASCRKVAVEMGDDFPRRSKCVEVSIPVATLPSAGARPSVGSK